MNLYIFFEEQIHESVGEIKMDHVHESDNQCMFGLKACKSMFEPKIFIEFLLVKRTFRSKRAFAIENQIWSKHDF